jgi:Tol biopolymer transport system component
MTVSAPPRPPAPGRTAPDSKPLERDEIEALVEALIEEARRETRRRHRRYWALAAFASVVGVGIVILLERAAASQPASSALSAQSGAASGTASARIAFLRGGPRPTDPAAPYKLELAVINADGSGLRILTHGPWSRDDGGYRAVPVWSPDGRKLVFSKRVERPGRPCKPVGRCNDEIYVINVDGTGLRRLTRNAVPEGHPVWSPDGQRIAFVRWRAGPAWNIYVMNADGSGQRRLTQTPRRPGEPAWSPEGEKIAFSAPAGRLGAADVFVINADGSGLQNVTTTETTSFDLAWSPDGRQIAYVEIHLPELGSPLYVVNADGTGKHRLTPPLAVDLGIPSWSPDGRTLAFTGVGGIYAVHADGSGLRKLTGHGYGPEWSPDGRKIAFISDRDDPAHRASDIFVMNADGSGQRNLTHTPNVSEHTASWAPAPG